MENKYFPARGLVFAAIALTVTLNSFAGLDPKIRKPAKSAVPKVGARDRAGGYSTHKASHDRRGTVHDLSGYKHSEKSSPTFGIVTSVLGQAFSVHQNGKLVSPVKTGDGVLKNDLYWVEGGALLQISSIDGGRVAVSGPAAVGFHAPATIRVYRGSVRVRASANHPMLFSSVFLESQVEPGSDSAYWVSKNKAQAIALSGSCQTWHPELKSDIVHLPSSYFTEHGLELEKKYLQPRFPELVEEDSLVEFLSRFEDANPKIDVERSPIRRGLASIVKNVFTGTRKKAELEEHSITDYELKLRAHIAGKQWPVEQESEPAPLASRTPSSLRESSGESHASSSGARVMNPQTEALIRKFVSGK